MTDPIRIAVRYGIDNTTHATITPDIARQIVGLIDLPARIVALEGFSHMHSGYASVITTTEQPAPVAAAQPAVAIPSDSMGHSCRRCTRQRTGQRAVPYPQ